MSTPESFKIHGHALKCSHCGNDTFFTRESLLNTAGMTFFKLDWLNQPADNYVYSQCGHIERFLPVE